MLAFLSPRRTSCEYEMSFPFQQYDYSAESTPNAFTWPELEQDSLVPTSATTPNQPASISPPALQQSIQALPHSPTEHVPFQQHQHHQQQEQPQQQPLQLQQQEPHQIQAVFEPPQTNFVEDRFQPSQYHFDVIDESHFLRQQSGSHVGRPGTGATTSRRPPLRVEVDDVRPAGRNTSESAPSAGPARVPHGRPHTQTSHPYKRPETASGKRSVSASTSGQILRPSSARQERVVSEQQYARLLPSSEREPPRPQLHGSVVGVGSAHPAPMPTVGVGSTSVSCPAISIWRVNQSYNSQQNQIQRVVSGGSSAETAPTANTRCADHFSISSLRGGSSYRPALVFLDRPAPPRSRCRHLCPSTHHSSQWCSYQLKAIKTSHKLFNVLPKPNAILFAPMFIMTLKRI